MHILLGALIGAVVGVAVNVITCKVTGKPITWQGCVAAGLGGAIFGGMATATVGASLFVTPALTQAGSWALAGAASGFGEQLAYNTMTGDEWHAGLAQATGLGALAGVALYGAGKYLAKPLASVFRGTKGVLKNVGSGIGKFFRVSGGKIASAARKVGGFFGKIGSAFKKVGGAFEKVRAGVAGFFNRLKPGFLKGGKGGTDAAVEGGSLRSGLRARGSLDTPLSPHEEARIVSRLTGEQATQQSRLVNQAIADGKMKVHWRTGENMPVAGADSMSMGNHAFINIEKGADTAAQKLVHEGTHILNQNRIFNRVAQEVGASQAEANFARAAGMQNPLIGATRKEIAQFVVSEHGHIGWRRASAIGNTAVFGGWLVYEAKRRSDENADERFRAMYEERISKGVDEAFRAIEEGGASSQGIIQRLDKVFASFDEYRTESRRRIDEAEEEFKRRQEEIARDLQSGGMTPGQATEALRRLLREYADAVAGGVRHAYLEGVAAPPMEDPAGAQPTFANTVGDLSSRMLDTYDQELWLMNIALARCDDNDVREVLEQRIASLELRRQDEVEFLQRIRGQGQDSGSEAERGFIGALEEVEQDLE